MIEHFVVRDHDNNLEYNINNMIFIYCNICLHQMHESATKVPSISLFCVDSIEHAQLLSMKTLLCSYFFMFVYPILRIWMSIELKKHSDIRFDACGPYRPQSSSAAAKMTRFPQWSKETCSKTISVENSHFKLSCGAIAYISPLVSSVKWQLMSFINMLNRPFFPSFCSCSVHCKVTSSGIFLIASQLCHWAHLELHLYANSGLWGWEEGSALDNSKCINSTWS